MGTNVSNFQNNAKNSNIILTSESNEMEFSKEVKTVSSFKNSDFGELKIIIIDEEPYFIGSPIASFLGYTNPRKAIRDHVDEDDRLIVSENQAIIIEDLNVKGMLKNHCLAKGIASASWSEFFRMLQYKSDWRGVNLIRIGRFEPSSKMCGCGYIHRDLKLSDRIWTCPECGAVNDRDLLAANNIKKFGLEKQNLLTQENINKTPVVNWEGDVELSAVAGAVKRQNVLV